MSNKRSRPTTERGIVGYAAAGAAQQGQQGIPVDRAIAFTARLRSINKQYAEWVQQQCEDCLDELWLDGADSYQRFIRGLLAEFDDIMGDAARESSPQDVAPSNLFGTPAAGIGPPGSSKAAGHTGVSTGRKSVTWAETPVDLGGPAAAAPPSSTPNPNTANAGHTPAPAGFRGAAAGTPGSSTDGTPAAATPLFRLTPGADAPAAGSGGSGFGNGVAAAMQRAAAAATPPPSAASSSPAAGGFSFGAGSGGGATPGAAAAAGGGNAGATPAAAAAPAAPPASGFAFGTAGEGFGTPAPVGSTPGGFTFGTPGGLSAAGGISFGATPAAAAGGGAGSTGAAAAAAPAAAFSFGVPASSSAAGAAAAASSPAFSFGAPPASNGTASGSAASQGAISFGVTPPAGASTSGGAPASAGFSFGALPSTGGAAASTSSPAFAFAATGAASSSMFQFPAPSAAAAAANGNNDGAADGGDDDAGPVEEATQVQVDGSAWQVLFNEKAKLFARVDGEWQDRGVGMCSLRQPTSGPSAHKSYLMFTTLNGKQLATHELKAGAAVARFDNSRTSCRMSLTTIEYELPPAGAQQQGEAAPPKKTHKLEVCLLKFGKEESVNTLEQLVEQHRVAA